MKALILALLVTACSPMAYVHDVPNLAQVDPYVWRSGQIDTTDGWDYFKEITGAKHITVVKLNYDNEGSDDLAEQLGFEVIKLPIQPAGDQGWWGDIVDVFKRPDWADVMRAVLALSSASPHNTVLVHCTHGQDRTGFVVGVYRVLVDGWTKERAYGEMLAHHFHSDLFGLQEAWEDFKP